MLGRSEQILCRELEHDLVLSGIGVLVLVDEDVPEAPLVLLEHLGMATEELDRHREQVVEVHGPRLAQTVLVLDVGLGDLSFEDVGCPIEGLLG